MHFLREHLFGPLPSLGRLESMLLRFFMVPNLFLVKAKGIENISGRKGPLIFAFNHNNSIESLLVPSFLIYHSGGRKISFVIDWMYGRIPLLKQLFGRIDPVYVYHKRSTLRVLESKRAALRTSLSGKDTVTLCCQKLGEGKRIGIFPEGKRNRDPLKLMKARPGIGHIALRSGVSVVPVGIGCVSGRKRKKVHAFGRISLNIGTPLSFDTLAHAYGDCFQDPLTPAPATRRHRLALQATERIMAAIAELCGKTYAGQGGTKQETASTDKCSDNPKPRLQEAICHV
ncbi:MAG: 1-acyl-sn-glycerol-3-phosphate acyltransferase [Prosthecochloris sp.]|nr:1-acyl-sn-glycerol-3-phosphate acyltransferase [Prosthecochloris sp.]